MDELGVLKKKVASQEKRIKRLEAAVYDDIYTDEVEKVSAVPLTSAKSDKSVSKKTGPPVSFNQVITILGILGISIGAISFFFYAIANGWIGKTAQVGIGALFGFVLFAVAFILREKNQDWSNIVFGGAYFLEYLSIGVGVSVYNVIPAAVGVLFGFFILVSSIALTVKFSSRTIAYFSLIGGFLIPIITDTFDAQVFVMLWYLLILIAMTIVSISSDWGDLRAVMLTLVFVFISNSFGGKGEAIEFLFLGLYFVLFNASSMINSVMKRKEMNGLDSLILGVLPVIFLPLIYNLLESGSSKIFGLIVILFSFVYLLEAVYLKSVNMSFFNAIYTLIAAGVATLNFGIYFLFNELFGLEFFIIFFIAEWALFSYLSYDAKDSFYKVISFFFLALIVLWFLLVLRFNEGVYHASFFMVILTIVPIISLVYFRSSINYKISAATFIISGYLFFYSFFKYLFFFVESLPFREIILSILWLIYTLVLFNQVQTSEGKTLVGILLGVTLIKIAFRDLLFLDGAFRIIGFILFGVLLLIGGYFLKNEKS